MAFGQQAGRPANGRQLRDLEDVLARAGYPSFRDARGPLGLNQRQGAGKFTDEEATELTARLEREVEAAAEVAELEALVAGPAGEEPVSEAPKARPTARRPAPPAAGGRDADRAILLKRMPDALLATELERRGWTVIAPADPRR